MAKKYIDTEKLIAEIERLEHENCMSGDEHFCMRRAICLGNLRSIATPLQQEQPEVDLEKEIATYFHDWIDDVEENVNPNGIEISKGRYAHLSDIEQVARHFYELGLKARKEE